MTIGAAFGALGTAFADYGINDDFIKRVRSQVTEGTSALFLMTSQAVINRLVDAMNNVKFEIIATNLQGPGAETPRGLWPPIAGMRR